MFIKPFTKEKIAIPHPHLSKTITWDSLPQRLVVDVVGGNLSIEAGDPASASLEVLWDDKYPLPKFYQQEETLYLHAQDKSIFLGQKRPYAYNLKVPKELAIHVKMKAGVISLDGLHGDLDLSIAVGGSIEGAVASSKVKAHLKAGDIRLLGLHAKDVKAVTYFGNVEISLQQVLPEATLDLKTHLGDVKILFPSDLGPYCQEGVLYSQDKVLGQASTLLGDVKVGVYNRSHP